LNTGIQLSFVLDIHYLEHLNDAEMIKYATAQFIKFIFYC